jgi:hypothetical protein
VEEVVVRVYEDDCGGWGWGHGFLWFGLLVKLSVREIGNQHVRREYGLFEKDS